MCVNVSVCVCVKIEAALKYYFVLFLLLKRLTRNQEKIQPMKTFVVRFELFEGSEKGSPRITKLLWTGIMYDCFTKLDDTKWEHLSFLRLSYKHAVYGIFPACVLCFINT